MIVADSGPIISLARADLLNILPALLGQVVLPPAVFAEITALPDKPGAAAVRAAQWVRIEVVPSDAANLPLARALGPGERDAIRLARALRAVLILDERRARREATRLGIALTSTLAILEEAKRRSLVPSLAEALDRLQASGFRLRHSLREEALRRAGES